MTPKSHPNTYSLSQTCQELTKIIVISVDPICMFMRECKHLSMTWVSPKFYSCNKYKNKIILHPCNFKSLAFNFGKSYWVLFSKPIYFNYWFSKFILNNIKTLLTCALSKKETNNGDSVGFCAQWKILSLSPLFLFLTP